MGFNYSKGILTTLVTVLFATFAFSQVVINGTVVDSNNLPITGAKVSLMGTKTSSLTDLDGMFSLTSTEKDGVVEIIDDLTGSRQIRFKAGEENTVDLGMVILSGDGVGLAKLVVVGRGVIDLSEDRETPIATSVISASEIQERAVGNVEFPEAMKNTPNVYVSNQAGGFGDAQMFLRGFDQSNTAFLLNGQPINGMEDGKMYWSNWAGVSDIANGIQVQRGLGSSKLAISSVGGTVNIVTKATEKKQGGFARFLTGNDSYFKGTVGYNTGLMDNGWGVSFMVDHWQGWRKYAEGTAGQGQNYFLSVGKLMGDHNFNFIVFGAPQSHEQNYSKGLEKYKKYGLKYNNNYGFLNGERTTWRKNYYHKPVMNFNWDWDISSTSSLSTVLYASFGRGGGTGPYGKSDDTYKLLTNNGLADFGQVYANNMQVANGIGSYGNGAAIRASVNNHRWFGLVTSFENEISDELTFNIGGDVRFYKGDHFRQLVDLLGLNSWEDSYKRYSGSLDANGQYLVSNTFDANPWAALFDFADEKDRIAYDNSEWINYQGVFGQLEYAVESFSAFFQGAASNQSYKKEERFSLDHEQSDKLNRFGYNLKGGFAVNVSENSKLFANAGFYSRQPFLDNIFEYNAITERVPEVENEEITGLEAGYTYRMGKTQINLNGYYTKWANRFLSASGDWNGVADVGFRFLNIAQVHKGLELDFKTKPYTNIMLRGYVTYNEFKYDGDTDINLIDPQTNDVFGTEKGDLTGTFVGDAPMVSAGLGTQWEPVKGLSLNADVNYYGKIYGFVDVADVAKNTLDNIKNGTNKVYQAEKINDYATVDVGVGYTFDFAGQELQLRGNVYNLFNNEYISRKDNYGYYYGNGTTWNASIRFDF